MMFTPSKQQRFDEDDDASMDGDMTDPALTPSPAPMQTPVGQRIGRRKLTRQAVAQPIKKKLRFFSAGTIIPHSAKNGEGEDAMFMAQDGSAMAVSDGVGGWSKLGIDSGEYSRELMHNANRFVEDSGSTDPLEILCVSHDAATKTGTATACIMTINGETMRCANLGDSGYVVLRPNDNRYIVLTVSESQQHDFNCPKQIGTNAVDHPHDADRYEVTLREGDLVIMGTDGLFDNLGIDDIITVLGMSEEEITNEDAVVRRISHNLARAAYKVSQCPQYTTPFARAAQEHDLDHEGGKEDDITVIFAVVGEDPYNAKPEVYFPPSAFPQVSKQADSSPSSVYLDYDSSASPASTMSSSPSTMHAEDIEETFQFGIANMDEEE